MENKVIVKLIVPEIDETFDIYLPVNKKIGNIVILLNKTINEITNGAFPISNNTLIYNQETRESYDPDTLLINTNIRNGSKIILITN